MNGKANIKRWRTIRRMSQSELAEKAQINQSYLSSLERYHKSPTLKVFMRICEALNICPHRVMEYSLECPGDCAIGCMRD